MKRTLIEKYNVPGPRYTSYPTVPHWNKEGITLESWKKTVLQSFQETNKAGISIYIHLPFCESLCTFCGCHKHITRQHNVEDPYIDAVLKEWQLYIDLLDETPVIKELHLGGGTPTFFSPENLEKLINGIFSSADSHPQLELSFEGHPNNTTQQHLLTLYRLGFTRVSFGVQDYAPNVQEIINRVQPFEKVKTAHEQAKQIGYTSISHDLVFGLPLQTQEDIVNTIELTNSLKPDRISLYSYAHVPWIKGLGQRGYKESDLPSPVVKRAMYDRAKEMLENNAYHEIGMDHFALATDNLYHAFDSHKLHRNFMGYTTNSTQLMIGLGMSSISDSWYAFAQNLKTVKEYIVCVNNGNFPIFRGHLLTSEELVIRMHILSLMCSFQTSWDDDFKSNPQFPFILQRLKPLIEDNLVKLSENQITVTKNGKAFIRNICMCFDTHFHQEKNDKPTFSKTI